MRSFIIKPIQRLKGTISLPGDKSIAHRAIILSAISSGRVLVRNFPSNDDCRSTIEILANLGIKFRDLGGNSLIVYGKGLHGFNKPRSPLFVAESGTTLRIFLGILAGQGFQTIVEAGPSLLRRPMLRVIVPLRLMGAEVRARIKRTKTKREEYPPIVIKGGILRSITYKMPVASAQVKSAVLLAGLYARGRTVVIEPVKTRDHTERMLKLFSAGIKEKGGNICIDSGKGLKSPGRICIPGDISSAGFFIVAAAILPGSRVRIKNLCLNPTRLGIIKVMRRMGADIQIADKKFMGKEPAGDLIIKGSSLQGTTVKREEIPSLIDELPVLMVAASFAHGRTVFYGVEELRVKETDRINSMRVNLSRMGVQIKVITGPQERIEISGKKELKGTRVSSFNDHRTAMSMVVAGLKARGSTRIDDITCIKKSFPEFTGLLGKIAR